MFAYLVACSVVKLIGFAATAPCQRLVRVPAFFFVLRGGDRALLSAQGVLYFLVITVSPLLHLEAFLFLCSRRCIQG